MQESIPQQSFEDTTASSEEKFGSACELEILQPKDIKALVMCSYKHAVGLPWKLATVRQKGDTVVLSMLLRMMLFLQTRWGQIDCTDIGRVFVSRYGTQFNIVWEDIMGCKVRGLIIFDAQQKIRTNSGIISRGF